MVARAAWPVPGPEGKGSQTPRLDKNKRHFQPFMGSARHDAPEGGLEEERAAASCRRWGRGGMGTDGSGATARIP